MMDREQFLLIKLAEEASEVAQIALKAAQYGLVEQSPTHSMTNAERVREELTDLLGIVAMLNWETTLSFAFELPDNLGIEAKRIKTEKFRDYARGLGKVE